MQTFAHFLPHYLAYFSGAGLEGRIQVQTLSGELSVVMKSGLLHFYSESAASMEEEMGQAKSLRLEILVACRTGIKNCRMYSLSDDSRWRMPLESHACEIAVEGCRQVEQKSILIDYLGGMARRPLVVPEAARPRGSLRLNSKEKKLIESIDGSKSVEQICSESGRDQLEALQSLAVLNVLDVLEIRGEVETAAKVVSLPVANRNELEQRVRAIAERQESGDYYQALGIKPTAALREIQSAYYTFAKEMHPDRLRQIVSKTEMKTAESNFARMSKIYRILSNREKKEEYDREFARRSAMQDMLEKEETAPANAADLFKQAAVFEKQGDAFAAINVLKDAVRLDPNPKYRSALARNLARNPRWTKDAEQELLKALETESKNPDLMAQLADLYVQVGLASRAERYYRLALTVMPGHRAAKNGILKLEEEGKSSHDRRR